MVEEPAEPPESDLEAAPDEGRGWHFTRLAFHPVTLSYATIAGTAVFSILTVLASPLAGAIGAAAVLVLTYVIVFVLAGRRAGEDFYGSYAEERGLEHRRNGSLPPATPLLSTGENRGAAQLLAGDLPGGLSGTLALYTYEFETTYELETEGGEGEPDVGYFDYTVVLAKLPEAAVLSDISCEPRSELGGSGGRDAGDTRRRLLLGDEAFDTGYEVLFSPRGDERLLRALFSPEFTRWLTREAPPDLAFELASGSLGVSVEDHMDSVEELDALCAAAALIAARLRSAAPG